MLVVSVSMWGSVEWILPLIWSLKNKENVETVLFTPYLDLDGLFKNNYALRSLSENMMDNNCYAYSDVFSSFKFAVLKVLSSLEKTSLIPLKAICALRDRFLFYCCRSELKEWMRSLDVDLCMIDGVDAKSFIFDLLKELNIPVGFYPTSTSFAYAPNLFCDNLAAKNKLIKLKYDRFDFLLADTQWRKDVYASVAENKTIIMIGPPKYDSSWMNYIAENNDLKSTNQNIISVGIFLKNDSSPVYQHMDFDQSIYDLVESCLNFKNVYLKIKPHPRQNVNRLMKILNKFPKEKWSLTEESSILFIKNNDYIVSMLTGVIINALILNKQVIEFFDFHFLNNLFNKRIIDKSPNVVGGLGSLTDDGDVTSIYRRLNLVVGANTKQELSDALSKIIQGEKLVNTERIREYFPDGACDKGMNALTKIAERGKCCV